MTGDLKGTATTIATGDGVRLGATLFNSGESAGPVTVIASAVGVPQRYYQAFAGYLAHRGRTVLIFDWRGIGASLDRPARAVTARLRDWGAIDVPAVLDHATRVAAGRPLHWIGHSYGGGFAIALAANNHLIARHLGIATPHAYWRDMASPERYRIAAIMKAGLPLTIATLGYVPGRLSGFGEDLPGGVAREWARWIMNPDSMFGVLSAAATEPARRFTAPMCFIRFTDDRWATERDTERIAARFTAAPRRIAALGPADAGGSTIGHMGFFRSRFETTLWPRALAWLDGGEMPGARHV